MAGGIDWFRWHHGSVTDPKFQLVARKAGVSVAEVIAMWACLLEYSGRNKASVALFDADHADELFSLDPGTALRILRHLADRGLIVNSAIAHPRRYYPAMTMRPSGGAWKKIRAAIFSRDSYTCQYCSAHGVALECDHVVPVADGGSSDKDNLTTACRSCNRSKAARSVSEWAGRP